MIDNYIFDLYGTLIHIRTDEAMPSLWKRMALLLSLQGAAYETLELQRAYGAAVEEQIDVCHSRRPAVPRDHVEPDIRDVFRSLYGQKGVYVDDRRTADTALFFRTLSVVRPVRPYPGAVRVLQRLRERGKGVYLLSNAQAAFTRPELTKLGMTSLFDGLVLSSDAGVKKPDKAIFEHLFSKYGLRPETCGMIGNDVEADMAGAANVGMAGWYIQTDLSPAVSGLLPEGCRRIRQLTDLLR